ncbi:MAG: hypothetical protein IJB75_01240 [Oscillospiraceae bacterium]|nr:hypothetical protein [Oscillospiraceae bacterium]
MKRTRRLKVNLLSGRAAALWLLCILYLTGSIVGCTTAGLLDAENCGALLERFDAYFLTLQQDGDPIQILPLFWRVMRVPLAAFLLGLTALGIVGLPVLFAVRGFSLAYAVAVLYRLMGVQGLALGGCLFGVSALVWIPALFGLGVSGITNSYGLLRRVTGDGRYPLPSGVGGYWLCCGGCAGAVLVCLGIECTLVPMLVKLIMQLF